MKNYKKQYELTNHLGNVMAVVSDKVVEEEDPTTASYSNASYANLATPAVATQSTSLKAAYDYYPFGMLMPYRFYEDKTKECAPLTVTKYETKWTGIFNEPMTQPTEHPIAMTNNPTISIDPDLGTTFTPQNPSAEMMVALSLSNIEANRLVRVQLHIDNASAQDLIVELKQHLQGDEWAILANTSVSNTADIDISGEAVNNNDVQISLRVAGGRMTLKNALGHRQDFEVSTSTQVLCSYDPDFADDYRFGFNGKEKDNEVMGEGNFQDYGLRMYNTRLGRFISEDPLTAKFPMLTPYQFASNTPIMAIDLDGAEAMYVHGTFSDPSTWNTAFIKKMNHATGWDKKANGSFTWKWSGGNSMYARRTAAFALVSWLNSDKNPHRDAKHVTLIGHSHGGNVNKIAKNILEDMGWKVDMVNVETPQRSDIQSNSNSNGVYLNFYSTGDVVQWGGAVFQPGENGRRIDPKADDNNKLPDGGLISDGLGHSLHNNEKCEEQIIKQTEDAFNKEAQPPLESKPLPQSTSPYQVKAKDANGG